MAFSSIRKGGSLCAQVKAMGILLQRTPACLRVALRDYILLLPAMEDDFHIRLYQPGDQDHVISLWNACGLLHPSNNPHKDIERKLRVDPERFLVGVLEGHLIATVMAGYEGHRGVINYLGVHPQHQRQGYAKRMLAEAERLLRAAGCAKINLHVREGNLEAMRFYEAIGYSRDPVIPFGKRLEFDSPDGGATANDPLA